MILAGIRNQFHHFVGIVPTIQEAVGLPAPVMVNGIPQKPMDGVSMVLPTRRPHTRPSISRCGCGHHFQQ
jgi:arylsulfatase A-like enzyme